MKIIRKNNAILTVIVVAVLMMSVFVRYEPVNAQPPEGECSPYCENEFKIDSEEIEKLVLDTPKEFNINGYTVTITVTEVNDEGEPIKFNWQSTLGICAVIVKGGTETKDYTYDPLSMGANGLEALDSKGISHITFCYPEPECPPPDCNITGDTKICDGEETTLCATTNAAEPTYSWTGPGTFESDKECITVSDEGTYEVTITDEHGCESTCDVYLTVYSLPTCDITGDTKICDGEETTLCATTNAAEPTYSWTGPGTFESDKECITVSDEGTYEVTITDEHGCESTCDEYLTVDPCEEPECPTCSIAPVEAVCEDDSVVFSLDATIDPEDYTEYDLLWSDDTVAGGTFSDASIEDPTWTPPAGFTGTATLTLTVTANDCESTCTVDVTVYPKPDCSITAPGAVCDETTGNIASTTAGYSSYIWLIANGTITSGQGTNKITFSVTPGVTSVTIGVKVVDSNGCENYCSVKITIDPCEECKCSLVVLKRDEAGNPIENAVFEVDGIEKTTSGGDARWDNLECNTTYEVKEISPEKITRRITLGDCGERSTMRVVNKGEEGELEVLGIMEVLPFTGPAIPYSPFIGISTVLAGTFLYILSKSKKKR